ncbi:MAG: hypothetical protein EDM05_051755 [Leptolyngbya sp. IPPAS B-1204]
MLVSRPQIQPPPTQAGSPGQGELSLREKLAQKRKAARLRKEVTNFTIFSFLFALFVSAPLGLIGGPKVAVAVVVAILCLSLSFKYPRLALWAF